MTERGFDPVTPTVTDERAQRIYALEAEAADLRERLAVAVANPCAGCQAELERLREGNRGWSEEVNRIEGELRGAIAEGLDYRKALEEILEDVCRAPDRLRNSALATRVAQRAQTALSTAGGDC